MSNATSHEPTRRGPTFEWRGPAALGLMAVVTFGLARSAANVMLRSGLERPVQEQTQGQEQAQGEHLALGRADFRSSP